VNCEQQLLLFPFCFRLSLKLSIFPRSGLCFTKITLTLLQHSLLPVTLTPPFSLSPLSLSHTQIEGVSIASLRPSSFSLGFLLLKGKRPFKPQLPLHFAPSNSHFVWRHVFFDFAASCSL
jgi:hypothetical protein